MKTPGAKAIGLGGLVVGLLGLMAMGIGAETIYQRAAETHLAFEGEWPDSISDDVGDPGTTWVVVSLGDASGGEGLGAACGWTAWPCERAAYKLFFDKANTYEMYVRYATYNTSFTVQGDGSNDSFYLPPDFDLEPTSADSENAFAFPFTWQNYGAYTINVAQLGEARTLTLGTREPGLVIDRIVFTPLGGLTATELDALPNSQLGSSTPEPGTVMLLGLGVLGLLKRRRRT